jgi:outer membrane protein assembly factor BamB
MRVFGWSAAVMATFVTSGWAADWPQFRGPQGGQAEAEDKRPLPLEIGPDRHVLWKVDLPPGHSSPVVAGNRIFLTAVRDKKHLLTIAIDRATGKVQWEREATYKKLEAIHNIGSHAQCSPATDGERVISFFGSSGLHCYSLDGELQWRVAMGPFNDDFGAASSPLIVEDRVILGQDHDTGSFLAAFDKKSGTELWRTDRTEFSRNSGSPILWTADGKKQIVVAGTLRVCGYDWDTGRELWTVRGLSRVVCMTPVIGPENMLIVAGWSAGGDPGERLALVSFEQIVAGLDANGNGTFEKDEVKDGPLQPRFTQCDRDKDGHVTRKEYDEFQMLFDKSQNVVMAIKPGARGDATETHVAWKFGRFVPFCSSPLYHNDHVYLIKDGGIFTCLDAKTGAAKKTGRVSGTGAYYASPTVGDGKIYLLSEKGQLSVVSPEASWQVLHTADFGEGGYASPAIVDGRIYLRVGEHLYCFGLSEKN